MTVLDDVILAAADSKHTGAMIALVPTEADLDRLALDPAIEGAEPREELHLTLFYLGDAADIPETVRDEIHDAVTDTIRIYDDPLQGTGFGVNMWNPDGEDPAWVIAVGDVEINALASLRHRLGSHLASISEFTTMPEQHTPWQPHVCVAYSSAVDLVAEIIPKLGEITFDRVRVAFAGEVTDISLRSATVLASSEGGATVPWHTAKGSTECSSDEPWAVIKDADGSVEGCHATEADANEQMRALYAQEDGAAAGSETETLEVATVDIAEDGAYAHWEGVIVVEGTPTGDGREFAPEALTWADPPLTLRWKKEDAHGGEHDVTVAVGRIDEVWRDGVNVMGRGVVDLGSPDGAEAARRLSNETLRGISIDADDISNADVEMIWPEIDGEDTRSELELMFAPPEKVIFHGGRIRAATLCDIPAFVEAYIKLTDAVREPPLAASVIPTVEATSDGSWDAAANEIRLPDLMDIPTALSAYAWVNPAWADTNSEVGRAGCRFIHHEVADDGTVGLANLTACTSAISILNRGQLTMSVTDKRAAYTHLAKHLRDAGLEPEPFTVEGALVAHAVAEAWRPPRAWLSDPHLGQLVPIIVTDEGRVYGHAVDWSMCHIGFDNECVKPPEEDSFPYYMTGELVCEDGSIVAVGQITAEIGHASISMRPQAAAEHYDNTGAVVADVTLGNDAYGIWVAGAVRPDAPASLVHKLRASGQVSPDWRRIGGELRMVALLTVNASGYQIPKPRARVASGQVQALVAAGMVTVGTAGREVAPTEEDLNKAALRRVRGILVARVHGKES